MTDDKSPFDKFIHSIWSKVSTFIAAIVAITGFVALFQKNLLTVGLITFGLITLILVIGSFGWIKEIVPGKLVPPIPTKTIKRPFLSPEWLKVTRIALGIVIIGWISWGIYFGYSHHQEQKQIAELENKVVILIAEIDGPDPKNYRVTEELITQLNNALTGYDDTVIIPLSEIITEQQGSVTAREIGVDRHADIVLWGYYGATGTAVRLTLHIENLHPEEFLLMDAGDTMQAQSAITELDSFTFQQELGEQVNAFISFISGYARFQAGDYNIALERFDNALTQTPWVENIVNLADALFYRGTTHFYLKNWERAISDFSDAININPNHSKAFNNRGSAYADQGKYDQAIQDYTAAIRFDKNFAVAYFNRGSAYADQGKYDQAIQDYTEAIRLAPGSAGAYTNRGNAYADLGQYTQAISDHTEAIQLNPASAHAYNNRGTTFGEQGLYKEALIDFDEAIRLDPDLAETYSNRCLAYLGLNEDNLALTECTKAISLDPNVAEAYSNRCLIYLRKNEYSDALFDCTKAISLNPVFAGAYQNRGLTYAAQGQDELALSDFQLVLTLTSDPVLRSKAENAIKILQSP